MKIVWSKADFESLRALLERELGPDEKLLWCGYTSTAWDTKRSQAYSVQLVSGVGVFVIAGVALSSISNSPEIAVFGLTPLLAVYMITIWPDAVYAITSKRIIAVRWTRIHQAEISQIADYAEIKHNGWTDLVFRLRNGRIQFRGLSENDITESIKPLLEKEQAKNK